MEPNKLTEVPSILEMGSSLLGKSTVQAQVVHMMAEVVGVESVQESMHIGKKPEGQ